VSNIGLKTGTDTRLYGLPYIPMHYTCIRTLVNNLDPTPWANPALVG